MSAYWRCHCYSRSLLEHSSAAAGGWRKTRRRRGHPIIHIGDCDELREVVQPLTSLTVPAGVIAGNDEAVLAEAAFSTIPLSLDAMLAEDHALKVHVSQEEIETYLACGDIGGTVDADGALIVGLKEVDGSGYTGIAYLVPGGPGETVLSVMIAKVLPGGGPGDATPAAGAAPDEADEAADAPDEAAASGGEVAVVGVVLNEFSIAMPTELAAGPTQFNVSNVGGAPHNLVIEGEGISERLPDNLESRQTGNLTLDLAPGTYTVFCPVGDGAHRANGMELEVTVV